MIFYLIYISEATSELTPLMIEKIVDKSCSNNQSKDISGMLLYLKNDSSDWGRGRFMQLLEGSVENVNDLYSTIIEDTRHSGCSILQKGFAETRAFSDWSMGYKSIGSNEFHNQIGLFLVKNDFLEQKNEWDIPRLNFLKSFYDLSQNDRSETS